MNTTGSALLMGSRRWYLRTLVVLALLLGHAPAVRANTVTATWDPNPESNIAGYTLSYGTQAGVYSTSIDVGNVTTKQVTLSPGQRYYFVVQAYNTSALVSPMSSEVFVDVGAVISSLSPTSGIAGTSVTITGANFGSTQGTSTVTFNGTVATPTSWNTTSIVAPVPGGATTGNVVVTVGGVASNGMNFTVTPSTPIITLITPSSGPAAGGTPVSIAGTNFVTGATVAMGGTAATSVVVVNATRITAKTGAHAAGTVNVTVTNPSAPVGTLSNGFTYLVFADDPLVAGSTFSRVVHLTELRARVDAVRVNFGRLPYQWTDPTLTTGSFIRAQHIIDLRTALSEAYTAAMHVAPPPYTDPVLTPGVTVKAVHIAEIRAAVVVLELSE